MTQIFVSYAHADHALLEKFLAALTPMTNRIGLTVWWDEELQAGQKWDARIRVALDASDVFLCFVTNAFLKPGGYIMTTELAKIREAAASRHALVLPVIAEPSHWSDEFGDTQAVPKTKKKALKPIVKWSPRSEGFHEASVQLRQPMLDFLNALPAKPDPGPGPAMAPTPTGFTLIGRRPSESEQADPALHGHHGDILDALKELEPYLDRLGNVDPKLVSAIRAYSAIATVDFADLPLDRLWSLGGRLCECVETVARGDLAEIFDERTLRDVTGELGRLHDSHAVLIMGTEEGRALTARVVAYRSAPRPLAETEAAAVGVLTPMTRQAGLLEPTTRGFVTQVTTPLAEGTERLDEIEAGLRTAVHAIAAFAAVLDPLLRDRPDKPADTAVLRRRFAGDPNLDTILAAFAYIEGNTAAVGAFARENPDLRRYVERTLEALGGIRRVPLRDPGEPPPGFDAEEVVAMILRGERVPREWIPYVTVLDFSGQPALDDLSPVADLGQLRVLRMSGTSVSDLAPLAGLTNLTTLYFSQTSVSDLAPLAGLTNLTNLYAWQTSVSDLAPLAGLTNLKTLYVLQTSVSDLAPLAGLTNLTDFDVSQTSVSDLGPLSGLTSLTTLDVSQTSVSDLAPLAGLMNLTTLYVSQILVSDLGPLSGLTSLTTLYVSQTSVSDLEPLSGLTSLTTLYVSQTSVSDLAPLAGLMNLADLSVSQTSVSDLAPLAGLTNLKTLYAWQTSVSDLAPLAGLTNLERLYISQTSVSDLAPLAGLTNLTDLNVSQTSVSDLTPLAGLTNLTGLHVSRTSVSDLAPLAGLTNLTELDVAHTPVRDLDGLTGGTTLESLDASGLAGLAGWPRSWPRSLRQMNLHGSRWPKNRDLPDVPWRIDPDGTIHEGDGVRPFSFGFWVDALEHTRREQAVTASPDLPDESAP